MITARTKKILLVLFYLTIICIAIAIKLSYRSIDAEAYYRDTISYAAGADLRLNSLEFWAGSRPFTLPLFYKLLGVDSSNYTHSVIMDKVSLLQAGISVICWAILGLVLSFNIQNRWLGALIFGLVLAFSLVYEISRWDLLLLSESLSFSLFALLLAGWILLLRLPARTLAAPQTYLTFVGLIIVTILYGFARSPNPYFLIICASLFSVALLFKRLQLPRLPILSYLIAVIIIFSVQYVSVKVGNRWQIFIYDELALRLTDTPAFSEYFKQAGLPMMEDLIMKPGMRGSVYEDMLQNDPRFEPVRQWINKHGMATFLGYLISNPATTLSQPFIYSSQMLNGTAESVLYHSYEGPYRTPLHKGDWLPRWLRGLTKILFPTGPTWVYGAVFLGLTGLAIWELTNEREPAIWIFIIVILLSSFPMMFLIWFGDPLEVERHALQIATSFRLSGWLALALVTDQLVIARGDNVINAARRIIHRSS